MHSLSDGPLHPWVTTTAVSMLRDKDGKYVNVENAHQAKWFPRNITYAMTILHGKSIFNKKGNFNRFFVFHFRRYRRQKKQTLTIVIAIKIAL